MKLLAAFLLNRGAVLLPKQHDGDTFAAQFPVRAPVFRTGKVGGKGGGEQSVLQTSLLQGHADRGIGHDHRNVRPQ